jgi:SAM-dependent methyltransferase
MRSSSWWTDYFDQTYLRIYELFLTAERTDREVLAIQELLSDRPGARILDLGCGWGRHSIELASSGFDVTGLDLSEFLLAEARRRAEEAGVDLRLVRADMRGLPFSGEFGAALSLFSSLGYSDDEADLRVLAGIRRALEPDGVLIIETMNRDAIAREFTERDWWETPEGDTVRVERQFDTVDGVSHETLHWRSPTGEEGVKRHSIRIRTATEWDALLKRAGFRAAEWFGDWSLEPLALGSEELIVVSRVANT